MILGASKDLNRFDCHLIEHGRSSYELKVVLKEGVAEAFGVPHVAVGVSSSS